MSSVNAVRKRVVETYIEGFRLGDHEMILGCLTDDVTWDMPPFFSLSGKQAFDDAIENDAAPGRPDIRLMRLVEEGEIVVAEGTVQAALAAGGRIDALFCDVFHFRGNQICRLATYQVDRHPGERTRRAFGASAPDPTVWPVLHYDDTAMALQFLVDAFGFRAALVVPDDDGDVVHAEMRWPAGGAVVFGSTKHVDGVHGRMRAGTGACYVVTDGVDAVFERAVRTSAEIVEEPHETTFGSGVPTRAFTARDPEGNLWTFGTYPGAP